jgi:S-DNA-T family DNA segregation ATPase FtsK/SpoIIIE
VLTDRIIGRVGADILSRRLADSRQGDGKLPDTPALFRLDKLSSAQIASIVREILANPDLSSKVDLRIPSALVEGLDLPESALTALNAGAVRNAGTDKEALLTANGNEHNLADTLGHVTPLGAKELRSNEDAWVEATCHVSGIAPTSDDRIVFKSALKGLVAASDLSLIQLGEFCWKVSEAISVRGHPIRDAIGWALPFVGLPRDTSFFANAKTYGTAYVPWRKAFEKLISNRAPFLSRLRANGQPLDVEEMKTRLEDHSEDIKDNVQPTLEAFINAPMGDDATATEVALLEWEMDGVHYIFDKPREKQQGLAESTIHFFDHDCKDPDVLLEQWRKHLEDLKARERRSDFPEEDDETFFSLHRRFIEEDPKLHSRWEKAIFGKPIECHDFLDGFISVTHSLVVRAGEGKGERFLRLTVNKGRKEWRERFNYDVGSYFSVMYRGLKELMGSKVEWRMEKMGPANLPDPLFKYPEFFAREREIREGKGKIKPNASLAKAAVQIKFEVSLIQREGDKETVLDKTQLVWSYRPESIGLSLVEDMLRLKEKGAVGCTDVPRRLVSKKGGVQSVSLLDTGTLEATYSRDAGSLVPPANRLPSMRADIKKRINDLAAEERLSKEQRDELRAAWDAFEMDYNQAIDDFINSGLHGEAVLRQAESFGVFLRAMAIHARGDVCRSRLVSEVLSIGTVRVSGDQPSLIIPPWHPERMKALAVKTRRVAGLVTHILSNDNVLFGDRGIFFREFSEELAHPFYPEIGVAQRAGAPVLVAESSTVNGYSLLERPVRGDEDALTDVDPTAAAKQVRELLERFVALQPHEASNLSVLLYNADAAELPLSVVRELSGMQTESDFQCNVSVRHRDPGKLRRVYAELVTKSGDDPDLPVVSETSENFISKLRIAVTPASATPPRANDGFRAFDIAFLHDVVSRTAGVEWIPVEWTNDRPSLEHAPSRWSYRSVSGENELKSTTFLTCPRQTASGWAYVGAVGSVVRQNDAPAGSYFLPARRISLQSEALKATMEDAHALAEWVATYDELLDKRQLQANGVTVVRYRRASTNGRNMIVSSTSELRLLGVLARRRLGELGLPFTPEEFEDVAARVKKDALSISGDIVLRAAKRGVSAGEMLGLVMSRYLLEDEFKKITGSGARQSFSVFFLLDDYADWLAQKESRIADILGLCVEEREDGPQLHVVVVESKYVAAAGAADAKRSSKAQLLATLSTFRAALFGDPGRLDRDVWLSRLADLLIDADIPPGCSGLLERARAKLREGDAGISLRGYSHVFIHSADPSVGSSASEQILLDDTDGTQAWQEVFDRPELRSLVEVYARKGDPSVIRSKLGTEEPWLSATLRPPAARVTWTAMMELLTSGGEPISAMEAKTEGIEPLSPTSGEVEKSKLSALTHSTAEESGVATQTASPAAQPLAQLDGKLDQLIAMKAADQSISYDERDAWAEETTKKLKAALNGYGLQASVLGTRLTPNGCLVRLAGSDRLRVEDVEAKRMQLLTTHAINLVTVQPKPGEIVVTIASAKRQSVSLWDLWSRRSLNRNAAGINTSFVLGLQEINGALLYLNLGGEFGGLASHEPHSLVAGATGSGKSVLIQAILLDIAATNPKELAQIVLIDPKMGVDYSALEDLPHMREKIVTTRERATEVLSSLVDEMENRYRLFASARARDLATYNAKSTVEERLPMIFLVHDEFADWMLDDGYKGAVSAAVQRLGVKARAAGIHLIFAAQRPDKDVMPMQLRENLGNRLILKVASEATSKIALDRPGAELLLGRGHLAAKLNGEQGLVFAQAPFLSDQDIEAAVTAIRTDNSTQ